MSQICIKPLTALSLTCIVDNMSLFCPDWVDFFLEHGVAPESPFRGLPGRYVQDIIESLKFRRLPLKRAHVQGLLVPHLTVVDLPRRAAENSHFVLEFAAERCQNLRILNLSDTGNLSDVLKKNSHLLKNLEELYLRGCHINDAALDKLGAHAAMLSVLDLSSCPHITDVGVMSLCVPNAAGQTKSGCCKKLMAVDVRSTQVTKDGIRTFFMNLPELKSLQHETTAEVLYSMGSHSNLKTMEMYLTHQDCDVLNACLRQHPSIHKLTVNNIDHGWCSHDAEVLGNLKELKVIKCTGVMEWFYIIRDCGQGLAVLKLVSLSSVCLTDIRSVCPNLQELTLKENTYESKCNGIYKPFEHLIKLKILAGFSCAARPPRDRHPLDRHPPDQDLAMLLASPKLQYLKVDNVPSVFHVVSNHLARDMFSRHISYFGVIGSCDFLNSFSRLSEVMCGGKPVSVTKVLHYVPGPLDKMACVIEKKGWEMYCDTRHPVKAGIKSLTTYHAVIQDS